MQVILDLGHVTLSNVSDWSDENEKPSQPQLLEGIYEDEDDGMCYMREREREKERERERERERNNLLTFHLPFSR